jgi:NTP pyrophosphatase (non-canonical NTP hydrolase)
MHIEKLVKDSHKMAVKKGFWEDQNRNVPEMLMLIVSELAEALEALRKEHNAPKFTVDDLYKDLQIDLTDEEYVFNVLSWKENFEKSVKSSFEDELADVAIRLFDLCGGLKIDLGKHIELKMFYNSTRGHKHGKKF